MSTPSSSSVVLLVGRTREDRRRALRRFQVLDEHQRPVFLYLTARRRKVEVLLRSFADPDKAPAFLPAAHTWGDWRDRLSTRFGAERPAVSGTARELLMGRVWRSVRPRTQGWRRLPDRPSVHRALADLVDAWEFAFPGPCTPALPAGPDELEIPGVDAPQALRHDLALLVDAWRIALRTSPSWTDRAASLRALLAALRDPSPSLLRAIRARSLVVDDLIDLPPLEREVLSAFVDAFVRASPDAPVHLCLEGRAQAGPEAFFRAVVELDAGLAATLPLRAAWAPRIEEGARSLGVDAEPERVDLADLAARDGVVHDVGDTVGGVRVRRYNDETAEVRAVARALKARLLEGGDVEDHHVAFPALDHYAPLVSDVFTAYGIPFRVERGDPLRAAPPVAAARKLLALADDGADRDTLRGVPTSGWVDLARRVDTARLGALFTEDGRIPAGIDAALGRHERRETPPGDVEALYRAAVEAGVDGPRPAAWVPALLRSLLSRPPREPRGWDAVVGVVEAALLLDDLVASLVPLREADSPAEVGRRFATAIDAVETGGTVDAASGDLETAEAAAEEAKRRLHALVLGLIDEFEAVATAVPGASSTNPLEVFRDAFERSLQDAWIRPPHSRVGVRVGGLRDLHGVDVPWLWVGGLVERDFPRATNPSFLVPPTVAARLQTSDPGAEDRAVFASLLRNAGHGERRTGATLVLSAPHTVDGSACVPSPLMADLVDLRTPEGALGDWFAARQQEEEAALPAWMGLRELLSNPAEVERMPGVLPTAVTAEVERHRSLLAARRAETLGRFDGVLGDGRPHRAASVEWVRRLLGVHEREAPTLVTTASGLERWASCGMRWFFERVLVGTEPDAPELEPSAAETGTLLHDVLEALLHERIELARQGGPPASLAGLGPEALASVKRRARTLLRGAAPNALPHRAGPWVERAVRELEAGLDPDDPGVAPWTGPLCNYLDEAARPFVDLEPRAVEWGFSDLDPEALAAAMDGGAGPGELRIALRGRVDRVDAGTDGLGGARLGVFDYKSGRLSAPGGRVDRGLLLQPVIYAAAAARRFAPEADVASFLTGYLELKEGEESGRRFFLGGAPVLGALRANRRGGRALGTTSRTVDADVWARWLRRAGHHGRWIAAGVFPPTLAGPARARCSRCEHRRACRVDHLRNADLVRDAGRGPSLIPAPFPASEEDG